MFYMATNVKKQFSEWIEKAFLNWQADNGKRSSLNEFAEYIGYSRPLISFWFAGQRLPSEDGIKRLAELFGLEVYDVLEIPRPDPDLERLTKIWQHIPKKVRHSLREQGEQYATKKDDDERPIENPA